jgi:hypothetical protein
MSEQQTAVPFRVRPYAGESNFVAGTWMRSYGGSRWSKAHNADEYFDFHAPVVNSLIENGTMTAARWGRCCTSCT